MPSLESVIAGIPGLAGYEAQRQLQQGQGASQLQQIAQMLIAQKKIEAQGQDQALRQAVAGSGGDVDAAMKAALAKGNVGAAAKLGPIVQARESAAMRREQLVQNAQNTLAQIQHRQDILDQRRIEFQQRTQDTQQRAQFEQWYKTQSMIAQAQQNDIMNHLRQQGIDLRRESTKPPAPGGPADKAKPDASIPPAAAGSAIPLGVQAASATGGSGFFGGIANTISDMVGAPMPYQNIETATQALKNLQVQTITIAQDAVPGRPSNYLMQQIERLSVTPGSLVMADQRAKTRLQQTRDMLQHEVARMEREVLGRPGDFTTAQLAKYRNSFGQLRQLVGEYDTILQSFDGGSRTQSGNIGSAPAGTPPPPPGFKIDR